MRACPGPKHDEKRRRDTQGEILSRLGEGERRAVDTEECILYCLTLSIYARNEHPYIRLDNIIDYSEGVEDRDDAPPVRSQPRATQRDLAKVAGAV